MRRLRGQHLVPCDQRQQDAHPWLTHGASELHPSEIRFQCVLWAKQAGNEALSKNVHHLRGQFQAQRDSRVQRVPSLERESTLWQSSVRVRRVLCVHGVIEAQRRDAYPSSVQMRAPSGLSRRDARSLRDARPSLEHESAWLHRNAPPSNHVVNEEQWLQDFGDCEIVRLVDQIDRR